MKLWRVFWGKTTAYPVGVLLILAGVGGIVFWGGFNTFMEYTNRMEFCISCHEMRDTVYKEYQASIHYENASGVRAVCSDCHVPKEWVPKLVRKVKATKELYYWAIGSIDTPEKFEARRLTMARRVWAEMESNDSHECRNCHSWHAMDFDQQRPESAKEMKKAAAEKDTCISCHKGIAHKMPDMTGGYKLMFEELQAQAAEDGAKSDVLYTIAEIPFYLNEDEIGQGKGDGLVLSATKLIVLDSKGDARKVRIEGWRQKGADRIMYELMRHRIFTATLRPAALEQVKVGEEQVDPDTDLTWMPVSIEGWVKADKLGSDLDALWEYSAEMYTASCATCHGKPEPDHYLANQWIGTMKAMKRFISLDKREYRLVQKYLQLHASDTGGKGH